MLSALEHISDGYSSPLSSPSDSNLSEHSVLLEGEEYYSIEKTPQKAKISTIRRIIKRALRFANMLSKTFFYTPRRGFSQRVVRSFLGIVKQVLTVSKIVKTAFAVYREPLNSSLLSKTYTWSNFMQSLLVGTIHFTTFFYPKMLGGKAIAPVYGLFCSSLKCARDVERLNPSSPYHILKLCKTILSIASAVFMLIGVLFGGLFFIPKIIAVGLAIAAATVGVLKSIYSQTSSVDENFLLS